MKMKTLNLCLRGLLIIVFVSFGSKHLPAQSGSADAKADTTRTPEPRDGQHDFDFAIGTWTTHLRRLQHPLTGSGTWVEYEGTSVVRNVWNGRANLEEFEASGPAHIEGLTLRLYNPQSHQWSQVWSTSTDGTPLMGLRIVQTQGKTLDMSGAACLEFFEIGATVPHVSHHGRALVFDPRARAC